MKHPHRFQPTLVVVLVLAILCHLPLRAQFTSTARHVTWGPTLPSRCSPNTGDIFFKTTATIGPYFCSAANTWTAISGGASGVSSFNSRTGAILPAQDDYGPTQFNCLTAVRTSTTRLTFGGNLTASLPCNIVVYTNGTPVVFPFTTPVTCDNTTATNPATIRFSMNSSGVLKANWSAAAGLACSGATVVASQSSYPVGEFPIARWVSSTVTGQWDATGTDDKAYLTAIAPIIAGLGLSFSGATLNASASTPIEYDQIPIANCIASAATPLRVTYAVAQAAVDCNGPDQPELGFSAASKTAYFNHLISAGTTAASLTLVGWGGAAGTMVFVVDQGCVVNDGTVSVSPTYTNVGNLTITVSAFAKAAIGTLTGMLPTGCTVEGSKAFYRITSDATGTAAFGWELTGITLAYTH